MRPGLVIPFDRCPSGTAPIGSRRAAERGRLIYAFDQAAWHATDEMRRKIAAASLPDPDDSGGDSYTDTYGEAVVAQWAQWNIDE